MGNTLIKEKEYNILLMFLDFYVCLVKNLISRTQWEKHVMKGRVQRNSILINMFSLWWYDYTFSCSLMRTHVKIKRSGNRFQEHKKHSEFVYMINFDIYIYNIVIKGWAWPSGGQDLFQTFCLGYESPHLQLFWALTIDCV